MDGSALTGLLEPKVGCWGEEFGSEESGLEESGLEESGFEESGSEDFGDEFGSCCTGELFGFDVCDGGSVSGDFAGEFGKVEVGRMTSGGSLEDCVGLVSGEEGGNDTVVGVATGFVGVSAGAAEGVSVGPVHPVNGVSTEVSAWGGSQEPCSGSIVHDAHAGSRSRT